VATVAGRLHFEQDAEYWPDSAPLNSTLRWEKWFWQSSTQGQSFEDDRDVPDADITQPARFRLRAWGISDNHEVFSESSCPESVPDHLLDCAFNDVVFTRRVFNGKTSTQGAAQTYDTTGVILRRLGNHLDLSVPNFTFGCPSRRDQTGLAWYELYYERLLQPADDAIEFRTHRGAGDFRYDIGPFVHTPPSFVFDATDPPRPVRLTGALASGAAGAFTLSMADTQTVSHRYAVVPDSVLLDNAALLPAAALADAPFTSKENL